MKKTVEIELKYQVLDEAQIQEFLKKLAFIGRERIVDIYLDTKDGNLYKKGIFIRIRNNKTLDFKYNLEDFRNLGRVSRHEQCNEHSFPLSLTNDAHKAINQNCRILGLIEILTPDLEELKLKNDLIKSVKIDKIRQKFKDGRFEYSFDDVKDLGKFLEIETEGQEGENFEQIKQRIREKVSNLNLKLITTGYNELYWRKYNYDLYRQGRYFLEEDHYKSWKMKKKF